jgi:hypothetical protein
VSNRPTAAPTASLTLASSSKLTSGEVTTILIVGAVAIVRAIFAAYCLARRSESADKDADAETTMDITLSEANHQPTLGGRLGRAR